MKYVFVKKSDMKVKDILSTELNLHGLGGAIRRVFYIFEESDDKTVSEGNTCTINQDQTRSYA